MTVKHNNLLNLIIGCLYISFFGLYYINNQLDAALVVLFISHCKITLHVSDAFCFHHQEY